MGIDYRAAIFVGLPRGEIKNEKIGEMIEGGEIEICPPYYDGTGDNGAIAGFEYAGSRTYEATELQWDPEQVAKLKADFFEKFGQEAKVYLSPYGY